MEKTIIPPGIADQTRILIADLSRRVDEGLKAGKANAGEVSTKVSGVMNALELLQKDKTLGEIVDGYVRTEKLDQQWGRSSSDGTKAALIIMHPRSSDGWRVRLTLDPGVDGGVKLGAYRVGGEGEHNKTEILAFAKDWVDGGGGDATTLVRAINRRIEVKNGEIRTQGYVSRI